MSDNPKDNQPVQPRNPTELLFEQTQSLSELVNIQKRQEEQIKEL